MHLPTLVSLRDQSKVSGPAHHLLLMLALYGYRETNVSCPSVGRLAHTLGVTPRHVRSLLKELVTVGAVRITHGGGRHTNTYEVIPPHAPDELSTPRHSTSGVRLSPRNSRAPQPGTGEPGTPEPECTQKRFLEEISKEVGVLAHEENEAEDSPPELHVSTDEHHIPTNVSAHEDRPLADVVVGNNHPEASDPGVDWEEAWRQHYDREVGRPWVSAPATPSGDKRPAPASVYALVAAVAAKTTLPAPDLEARRALLRAQSAALIAQGY
jgi:hypothetical protein